MYQDRETGKHVIAGTFARLVVPNVPGELGRGIAMYCALIGVSGSVQVTMQFETASGDVLLRSSALTLTCTNPDLLVELAIPVPALPLPHAGTFQFALALDGRSFATHAIEVAIAR
ncbi:MAG TPA: hypothetical protein VHW23_28595 [Kofleriaceae bacterium]|nr:hypothetical protein [Kofleriaceae bacterium]